MTACTITSHGFTKKFENFPTVADKHWHGQFGKIFQVILSKCIKILLHATLFSDYGTILNISSTRCISGGVHCPNINLTKFLTSALHGLSLGASWYYLGLQILFQTIHIKYTTHSTPFLLKRPGGAREHLMFMHVPSLKDSKFEKI